MLAGLQEDSEWRQLHSASPAPEQLDEALQALHINSEKQKKKKKKPQLKRRLVMDVDSPAEATKSNNSLTISEVNKAFDEWVEQDTVSMTSSQFKELKW